MQNEMLKRGGGSYRTGGAPPRVFGAVGWQPVEDVRRKSQVEALVNPERLQPLDEDVQIVRHDRAHDVGADAAVGDGARSDKRSSVHSLSRHSVNADYPPTSAMAAR
jgi:hypothetical protein